MVATTRPQNRQLLYGTISTLALTAAILACPTIVRAAEAPAAATEVGEVIVTATRRDASVQTVPFNIAAVSADVIQQQGLQNLADIAHLAPGVYIGDQGPRGDNRIVVRGLNASPTAAQEGLDNDGGGTVATYIGEIPAYVDLKLNDLQRVEVLLGPQGTLYGAGTLAGAVRYIPVKPKLGIREGELRFDAYGYAYGDGVSSNNGGTLNLPIGDHIALRGSFDWLRDRGFIDYPFVVQEPGVSNANPDFTNPADVAANLSPKKDANTVDTRSGRLAARWQPSDKVDTTLTYYLQASDIGARQISARGVTSFPVSIGKYESAQRVLEPLKKATQLLASETTLDLGFAELTSATGLARYKESGSRDQTDLLITLQYSYEAFPSFTAFTREDQDNRFDTHELRLVSKTQGPLSWIVGGFYNRFREIQASREFTPNYADFLGISRPDALEYISVEEDRRTESAAYGRAILQDNPGLVGHRRAALLQLQAESSLRLRHAPVRHPAGRGARCGEYQLLGQ